jgi:large subunit ribosomal protein L9
MEVILLERIARLGQMGDVVRVRDGYARNFLLPQGKALRANEANRKKFETEKVHLEARNMERVSEAQQVGERLGGQTFVVVRQAGETGQLYGSVTSRDLAEIMETAGFSVARSQIDLNVPLKTIGIHQVRIVLHPEVDTHVGVNVARSVDEAARQARGEDVTRGDADEAPEESSAAEPASEDEVPAVPEAEEAPETAESTTSP